ncbi:hypothetical protein Tco_0823783 [Tanacetum coccineum]|uniref:Uncharacterized protein n=1 Tax=Tanacetum coccineum TaxID=301880 RepID=A0ABQ5AKN2_9ASTR
MPHDSPLLGGHTPRSDEGSKKLNELIELCSYKVGKKVKHLDAKLNLHRKVKVRKNVVISDDEEDLVSKDTSKQGRITETEYEGFTLQQFTPTKVTQASSKRVTTYDRRRRSTDSSKVSTAEGLFSTAEEIQAAQELQKQLDQRQETNGIDWNTIVEQVQERQSGSMIRYQTLKKKPITVAQARRNMKVYLKNMAGYKMSHFKGMSYDKIKPIFEKEYNKVQTLFKKDIEVEMIKKKRVPEEILLQESFKKLRAAQASSSEPIQEQPTEEPKELIEEELKKIMEIVPVEEIKEEVLQVKYPIID